MCWRERALSPAIAEISGGSFKRREPPEVKGSGYVVKSLEAALWAFHKTDSFRDGALLAVNLGDDADTTGAVYGQLAGAYYGADAIPESWRKQLAMRETIEALGRQAARTFAHDGRDSTAKRNNHGDLLPFQDWHLRVLPAEVQSSGISTRSEATSNPSRHSLGLRVHETLENLYKCVRNGRLLTEAETWAFYESAWETNWSADVQIVESGLRADTTEKIGRQCVQDYYRHYQAVCDQGRVVDTEKRLSIKLDSAGRYLMTGICGPHRQGGRWGLRDSRLQDEPLIAGAGGKGQGPAVGPL